VTFPRLLREWIVGGSRASRCATGLSENSASSPSRMQVEARQPRPTAARGESGANKEETEDLIFALELSARGPKRPPPARGE
jgi:hypothetical protein